MSKTYPKHTSATITGLYRYPVKAMQGCALHSALLCEGGLQRDRQWAVYNADGHMLSQREAPQMSQIRAQLTPEGLQLHRPDGDTIIVNEDAISPAEESFSMWKDNCVGARAGRDVGQWLESALGSTDRLDLVKALPHRPRTFHHHARFNVSANYFSDAAPLLICNEASLTELNTALKQQGRVPIDHRHFRPNIIISGIEAFDEHTFSHLALLPAKGRVNLPTNSTPNHDEDNRPIIHLIDHCQRCSVITVNPSTGEFLDKGYPLTTLMHLNTMPGKSRAPAFGVNARIDVNGDGLELKLGQKLAIG